MFTTRFLDHVCGRTIVQYNETKTKLNSGGGYSKSRSRVPRRRYVCIRNASVFGKGCLIIRQYFLLGVKDTFVIHTSVIFVVLDLVYTQNERSILSYFVSSR